MHAAASCAAGPQVFYGLDDIVGAPEVIIVEGEMDKLALEEAGACGWPLFGVGTRRAGVMWLDCPRLLCAHAHWTLVSDVPGYTAVISVPDGAVAKVKESLPDPCKDVKFSYVHTCWDELSQVPKIVLAVDNDAPGVGSPR